MSWFQSSSDYNTDDERYSPPAQETYINMYDGDVELAEELVVISL